PAHAGSDAERDLAPLFHGDSHCARSFRAASMAARVCASSDFSLTSSSSAASATCFTYRGGSFRACIIVPARSMVARHERALSAMCFASGDREQPAAISRRAQEQLRILTPDANLILDVARAAHRLRDVPGQTLGVAIVDRS